MHFKLLRHTFCIIPSLLAFSCSDAGDRDNITDPANEEAYELYLASLEKSSSSKVASSSSSEVLSSSCASESSSSFSNTNFDEQSSSSEDDNISSSFEKNVSSSSETPLSSSSAKGDTKSSSSSSPEKESSSSLEKPSSSSCSSSLESSSSEKHICNIDHKNFVELNSSDSKWYVCGGEDNTWRLSTEIEFLNYTQPGTSVGELIEGSGLTSINSATEDSVYVWSENSWQLANNTQWYSYKFRNNEIEEGQYKPAKIAGTNQGVVYENGAWRDATSSETSCATACITDSSKVGWVKNFDGVWKICASGHIWSKASNIQYYTYTKKNDTKVNGQYEEPIVSGSTDGVVYENGAWRDATNEETQLTESCILVDRNKLSSVNIANANKYVCDTTDGKSNKSNWRSMRNIELIAGKPCTYKNDGYTYIHTSATSTEDFVCNTGRWAGTGTVTYAGQTYNTVIIGEQYWFSENLNYNPGDVSAMGSKAWSGCYNNAEENCISHGRLYSWEVAMNNADCAYGSICSPNESLQGLCPGGWHIPTKDEFQTLLTFTNKKIRSNSWLSANDAFGFSLLPAGKRYEYTNSFQDMGTIAYVWSSSEDNSDRAWGLRANSSNAGMGDDYSFAFYSYKYDGFAIRCLRNAPEP